MGRKLAVFVVSAVGIAICLAVMSLVAQAAQDQQAQQALGMARYRASDAEGGSTKAGYEQAHTDLEQAVRNENDTWQQFMDDPEG